MLRKGLIVLSIFILILTLFLVGCAKPDKDEDKDVYEQDQKYDIEYEEGLASCVMSLDGEGHCSISKEYKYDLAIDEENYRAIFFNSDRSFYLDYQNGEISIQSTFGFTDNNKLELYTYSNYSSYKTFADAIGNIYSYSYVELIDNMSAQVTLKIKPLVVENGEYRIGIGLTVTLPKYTFATGEYEIQEKKFIKLKFNFNPDEAPTKGLNTYEIVPKSNNLTATLLTEEGGRENGHIWLNLGTTNKYVQLYDNGTFKFVRAATTSSAEDCFTKDSYYGLSFTNKLIRVSNGEVYTYDYKLTFDNAGKATFECTAATMTKFYKANEGTISVVNYDIELYNSLQGTHVQLGTSNNISFTNNYKVRATFNYSEYKFEGDTNITVVSLGDYIYVQAKSGTGEDTCMIAAKFYEDGTWVWVESEFQGIDMEDHSDEYADL